VARHLAPQNRHEALRSQARYPNRATISLTLRPERGSGAIRALFLIPLADLELAAESSASGLVAESSSCRGRRRRIPSPARALMTAAKLPATAAAAEMIPKASSTYQL
jgi:hypothetical protein